MKKCLAISVAIAMVMLLVYLIWPIEELASELPPELIAVRDAARIHQDAREWCDAEKKWQELAGKAGKFPDLKAEAEVNGRLARERCAPKGRLVGPNDGPATVPAENDSTDASTDDLLKHYPAGRVVRSLALMNIAGSGSNQKWMFSGEAHFVYQARGVAETTILANNGSRIEFEWGVKQIDQNLVVSNQTLQLAPIDSPLLQVVWGQIDQKLRQLPIYRLVRVLAESDPDLKKTLTWINERIVLLPAQEFQYVELIDALSGHRFKIEYVADFGVRTIEVLEGDAVPEDDLLFFAERSGLLTDYVIGEVLQKNVGDEFSVDAKQVVRMIGLRYDVDVSGEIKLKREADEGELAVMSIVGGEVVIEADVQGVRRRGWLTPSAGTVKYHRVNLLVTEARVDWKADVSWATEDHLLFGTKGVRQLETKSYYEAALAP
jgi:hypothetical protein